MPSKSILIALGILTTLLNACSTPPATRPAATMPSWPPPESHFYFSGRPSTAPRPAPANYQHDMIVEQLNHEGATEAAAMLEYILNVKARAIKSSNTVIATGDTETLKLASNILQSLGMVTDGDNITFLYPLKNAKAVPMASIVNQLATTGALYTPSKFTAQTFAVAEPRSNTLIVNTPPHYVERLKKVLDELDKPLPATAPATAPQSSK